MKQVLLLFFAVWCFLQSAPSATAQDLMVLCSEPGSSDCTNSNAGNIDLSSVTYAVCCTMVNAEDRYYLISGSNEPCTRCGPILDEEQTLPTVSMGDAIVFSWQLAANSLIPTSGFVVGSRVAGTQVTFPNPQGPDVFSAMFLQIEGIRYIYRIRAESANGGTSPAIEVSWVTGDSLAPVLDNFRVADVTEENVTIEWVLRSNGIRPALNITLEFSLPMNLAGDEFQNKTINLADQPQPDGAMFNATFQYLAGGRYLLLAAASNSRFSSAVTPFTVDTNETEAPSSPDAGGISHAAVLRSFPALCLLFMLLPLYWP